MQLKINQNEIIKGIKEYISSQGIDLHNKHVNVSFTNGRKDSGLTADITIADLVDEAPETQRHVEQEEDPLEAGNTTVEEAQATESLFENK